MPIPSERSSEIQAAQRQIQRYRNSSSSPFLFFILFIGPIIRAFSGFFGHPAKPLYLAESFWMLAIPAVIISFHYYQRGSLKKKSDEAQKHLDLLWSRGSHEINLS